MTDYTTANSAISEKVPLEEPLLKFSPSSLFAVQKNAWAASVFAKENCFGLTVLEGIYEAKSPKKYGRYYYDFLKDELDDNVGITILVPENIRMAMENGKKHVLKGIANCVDRNDQWKVHFTVHDLLDKTERKFSEEDEKIFNKKNDLIARRTSRAWFDMNSLFTQRIIDGEKINVVCVFGVGGDVKTTGDVKMSTDQAVSIYENLDIVERRASMTNPQEIIKCLEDLDRDAFDMVCIVRGGGSGLETFDNLELAEYCVSYDKPVCCAIGHEPDHQFIENVVDRAFSTPTEFGVAILRAVENALMFKTGSNATLSENAKKPLLAEIERMTKEIERLGKDKERVETEVLPKIRKEYEEMNEKIKSSYEERMKELKKTLPSTGTGKWIVPIAGLVGGILGFVVFLISWLIAK